MGSKHNSLQPTSRIDELVSVFAHTRHNQYGGPFLPSFCIANRVKDLSDDEDISSVRRISSISKRHHSEMYGASSKPSTKRKALDYTSKFRPRDALSTTRVSPQSTYDEYDFEKLSFTINKSGNLDELVGLDEKIEVSKDWRSFSDGDIPKGGYISKGLTKFAFMVGGKHYFFFVDN